MIQNLEGFYFLTFLYSKPSKNFDNKIIYTFGKKLILQLFEMPLAILKKQN